MGYARGVVDLRASAKAMEGRNSVHDLSRTSELALRQAEGRSRSKVPKFGKSKLGSRVIDVGERLGRLHGLAMNFAAHMIGAAAAATTSGVLRDVTGDYLLAWLLAGLLALGRATS